MNRLAKPLSYVPLIRRRIAQLHLEIERLRSLPCVCELDYCLPCRAELRVRIEIETHRRELARVV